MRLVSLFLFALLGLSNASAQNLAITDATVYTSPEASAQRHATVLVLNRKVAAVGTQVRVPAGVPVLPCTGCVVFSGFWNCHVHFTGPQWLDAAHTPAATLTGQMRSMLSHSGFTTVVDAASDGQNTIALRRRVKSGEVLGPRIFTAGLALYPPHGIPFYLDDLPETIRALLLQPSTPAAAVEDVRRNIALGTDIVKLFTGSYTLPDQVVPMPIGIARAAVADAHAQGQLVFAHPSNLQGVRIATDSGVDVLAHAPDTVEGIDEKLLSDMVAHHMAMVPTLKLFSGSNHVERIRQIVARFHALGGQLMFGTDTGFLTDYSVAEEYHQLAFAGLTFRDVLSMLTTAPAARFRLPNEGRIQPGTPGDLTILSADPASGDLQKFAQVRYSIRAGSVIFDSSAGGAPR